LLTLCDSVRATLCHLLLPLFCRWACGPASPPPPNLSRQRAGRKAARKVADGRIRSQLFALRVYSFVSWAAGEAGASACTWTPAWQLSEVALRAARVKSHVNENIGTASGVSAAFRRRAPRLGHKQKMRSEQVRFGRFEFGWSRALDSVPRHAVPKPHQPYTCSPPSLITLTLRARRTLSHAWPLHFHYSATLCHYLPLCATVCHFVLLCHSFPLNATLCHSLPLMSTHFHLFPLTVTLALCAISTVCHSFPPLCYSTVQPNIACKGVRYQTSQTHAHTQQREVQNVKRIKQHMCKSI
jgi:hypothetical protein